MEEQYQKRAKYLLIFFFVVFATFLIFYFLKAPNITNTGITGSTTYNNFVVQKNKAGYGYQTKLYIDDRGPYYINTAYSPDNIKGIAINFDIKGFLREKQIAYVAIDPNQNLTGQTTVAAMELNNIIEPFFDMPVYSAFIKAYEKDKDYIIKTCPSQNNTEAIFLFRLGDETKILKDGNCIILQAEEQESLIKESDAIIFRLLGITK